MINQHLIRKMENNYPALLFTDSDARGIVYVTSAEDNRLGIVISSETKVENIVMLYPSQAKALADELEGMLMFIGRGKNTKRKRKKNAQGI